MECISVLSFNKGFHALSLIKQFTQYSKLSTKNSNVQRDSYFRPLQFLELALLSIDTTF